MRFPDINIEITEILRILSIIVPTVFFDCTCTPGIPFHIYPYDFGFPNNSIPKRHHIVVPICVPPSGSRPNISDGEPLPTEILAS
jgi:hypothetical protein